MGSHTWNKASSAGSDPTSDRSWFPPDGDLLPDATSSRPLGEIPEQTDNQRGARQMLPNAVITSLENSRQMKDLDSFMLLFILGEVKKKNRSFGTGGPVFITRLVQALL